MKDHREELVRRQFQYAAIIVYLSGLALIFVKDAGLLQRVFALFPTAKFFVLIAVALVVPGVVLLAARPVAKLICRFLPQH